MSEDTLSTLSASAEDARSILQTVESGDPTPIKITEKQARDISFLLKTEEYVEFTTPINLPDPLNNTRLQIELDNITANHQFAKKQQVIASDKSETQITPRILPQGVITPKVEITLHEESIDESPSLNTSATLEPLDSVTTTQSFQRTSILTPVIEELLSIEKYADKKPAWDAIQSRKEALDFIETLMHSEGITDLNHHPLTHLLENKLDLYAQLNEWTRELNLSVKQYDALLDVYGQYGASGIEALFNIWKNNPTFKDTYSNLFRDMETYRPFLEDPDFKKTMDKISSLSQEKRSWWIALIKNHTSDNKNISFLYQEFIQKMNTIQDMGLDIPVITDIANKQDLPTTLSSIIAVLTKCSAQDRTEQFACIHKVNLDKDKDAYFIIPEMQDQSSISLEELKTGNIKNKHLIKAAVYNHIARQKYHLPLPFYKKQLDLLFDSSNFGDESKCKMAYILAKTTGSNEGSGFDMDSVSMEWESFMQRIGSLDSFEKMKKNSNLIALGTAFKTKDSLILEAINPIVNMPELPPISYLNKLLKCSEYKFLRASFKGDISTLMKAQKEMMVHMATAATLYKAHPEEMMHAIAFINTEEIKENRGVFNPNDEDIELLAKFLEISTLLAQNESSNKVLLPLLSVFRLEYIPTVAIESLIQTYEKNIQTNHQIQSLLPYALSLFKLAQDRNVAPPLNLDTLLSIQDNIIREINNNTISSKKDVREWIDNRYNQYFKENTLRDIKEEVDFSDLFRTYAVTDKQVKTLIENILGTFDEPEEKEELQALALALITLANKLPAETTQRFLSHCQSAFKTSGLFARDKQSVTHASVPDPSLTQTTYLQQFLTLVNTVTRLESIDAFEEYMDKAQQRVDDGSSDGKDSLLKCDYLLDALYPTLCAQGIPFRDAFHFSTELVCSTPQISLIESYKVRPLFEDQFTEPLAEARKSLEELITTIHTLRDKDTISVQERDTLEQQIKRIATYIPNECEETLAAIDWIKKSEEATAKKSFWQQTWEYASTFLDLDIIPEKDPLWDGLEKLVNSKNTLDTAIEVAIPNANEFSVFP